MTCSFETAAILLVNLRLNLPQTRVFVEIRLVKRQENVINEDVDERYVYVLRHLVEKGHHCL